VTWPDDQIFNRLREWLDTTRAEANSLSEDAYDPLATETQPAPTVGFYDLAAEFTALRQELKLQTKSSRGVQEQAEAAIRAMQEATAKVASAEQRFRDSTNETGDTNLKLLAETVINLDESLDRGRAVIETARKRIVVDSVAEFEQGLDEAYRQLSFFGKWRSLKFYQMTRHLYRQQVETGHGSLFDSVLAGYQLIQNRVLKILKDQGIERIVCVGQPVDPHCMIVNIAVPGTNFPPGTVVQEIRRGYRWKGKVLRYAEVAAAVK
jgi:molecular chaperone GrpE